MMRTAGGVGFLILLAVVVGGGVLAATRGARPPSASAAPQATPSLTAASLVPAAAGGVVTVPFDFINGGNGIDTIFFELSYDAALLALDPADTDDDNVPDDLAFTLPDGYRALVTATVAGNEGRVQVFIFNENSDEKRLPPGRLLDATFDVAWVPAPAVTDVVFRSTPAPFFANFDDEVVPGDFIDGSVSIEQIPTQTATPTSTSSPTTTPSPTSTPTATPTATGTPPTPTATPTATPTTTGTPPTPTATATDTATATATEPAATPTATRPMRTPAPLYLPALIFGPSPTATATSTATATPTATATATATASPTPTTTRPPSPTSTPSPGCVNLIANGGFETGAAWQINNTVYPAGFVTFPVYAGARALRAGIVHPPDNVYSYSSAQQTIFIPAGPPAVRLSFRLFATTTGAVAAQLIPPPVVPTSPLDRAQPADDAQMVLLFDSSGRQHVLLFQRQWYGEWRLHEIDLTPFRGQAVTLYFGVFNNGTGGVTGMYVDEVAVTYCLP